MNQRLALFRQLLPGLLPLLIFIAADELWGTKTGLLVAMGIGMVELASGFIKNKKIDKFVLLDLLLIVAMGGISLWLENDFFFKLKPVIINAIMCAMLGAAAFLPGNILLDMSKRYFKNINIDPWQQLEFKKSMKMFFVLLVLYTLLTLLTVIYGTTREWGLVNGAGYFVLFGVFIAYETIRKKLQQRAYANDEWLPLVDEEGKILGRAPRKVVHAHSMLLHPVVHLHVFHQGKLYLQKRPLHKLVQPGKWDTAVGGHIGYGEPVDASLQREAYEEIGIKNFKAQLIAQYIWESKIEKELVFSFITHFTGPIKPNADEVDEGRFWSLDEIENNMGKGVFTPNFEKEFALLKQGLKV
jgi:isopentenyldiphosphate isomerase/intracellular septation protein A